jgi:hypothetical protein
LNNLPQATRRPIFLLLAHSESGNFSSKFSSPKDNGDLAVVLASRPDGDFDVLTKRD